MKKKSQKHKEIYGCMLCSFTTTDVEKQAQHWIEKHSPKKVAKVTVGVAPFECQHCGEGFRTLEGLMHHQDERHQGIIELTKQG